jgi:predicted DNA-binding protein
MKRNPGMRLSEESIQQLKELSEKNKRSMANMVEILIQNEYEKLENKPLGS